MGFVQLPDCAAGITGAVHRRTTPARGGFLTAAMRMLMRGAVVGLMFPNPQPVTNVPSGTIDDTQAGGPPDRYGWPGFVGGPGMCINEEGHKNWPGFHAPICGQGASAGRPAAQSPPAPGR